MTKKDLLTLLKKEYSTTVKVLEAYPEGKDDLKPHDKSNNAMQIARTFVFEMYLTGAYVFGDELDRNKFKDYNPFKLRRSAGVGMRFFLPMFGLLGFDYGIGFDRYTQAGGIKGAAKFTFMLGQEPE